MDYKDEYIKKNPTLHIEDTPIKFSEIKTVLVSVGRVKTLLDVGCGAGVLTCKFADFLKSQKALGVDISPSMIKEARAMNYLPDVVDFKCLDIFHLSHQKKFDLIICADIIEHLNDDVKFLYKLKKLGHKIVIRVPLEDSLMNHFLKKAGVSNEFEKTEARYGHVHHYSFDSFLRLVNLSGLKVESYLMYLINKKRTWWLNEILRQVTKILGKVSVPLGVRFGGGFLVIVLTDN